MAGKHVAAWQSPGLPVPGFQWNERTTKSYAEARAGKLIDEHPAGSDASLAFAQGKLLADNIADQFETATVGTV